MVGASSASDVDLRTRILDAAREMFAQQGYAGVSMRQLAARIGYSPTSIYLHFADKETLFRELSSHDFASLAENFGALAAIADPVERLRACGMGYIQFAREHPNHYRLIFLTPSGIATDPAQDPAWGNPDRDAYAFLLNVVRQCREEGAFRPELTDDHLLAQTLWAIVHGVAALEVAMDKDCWVDWRPVEERSSFALDVAMHGMFRAGTPDAQSRQAAGALRKDA